MERSETCDLNEEGNGELPRAVVLGYCHNLSKSITLETLTDRRRRTSLNQEQVNQLRVALLSVCAGLVRNKSFESKVMTVPFRDSDSSK